MRMRRSPTESFSYGRRERLSKRSDLLNVYHANNRVSGRGSKIFYRSNSLNRNRAAFVAGRGYRSAVVRNREKRRGREVYRRLKNDLRQGYDLSLIHI